jgi:endo-1,4-beta-xylanase
MPPAIARRRFLTGLAALPLAGAVPMRADARQQQASLATLAAGRRRFFGTAARIDQIDSEPVLRSAILRDCSCLTPEIDLKWAVLEPRQGRFAFAPADGLVAFARRKGLAVRGHTLLWHDSVPDWAAAALKDAPDWNVVRRYFAAVMSRYASDIREWDVVNEPIMQGSGADGLRPNPFRQAFGPGYVARALHEARALAPDAHLLLNEFSLEYDNPADRERRYLMLKLIERLKKDGVPLDGIGMQAHLDLAKGPLNQRVLEGFMREVAAFGLGITVTELDVKEVDRTLPLDVRDRQVADETRRFLDVALAQDAVRGVVTWGLTDRYSWLQMRRYGGAGWHPASSSEFNRGLPYDAALNPKVMREAIGKAFNVA